MNIKVSTSNTKAQILKAYDDVLQKLEEKSEAKPKEVQQRKEAVVTVASAQKNTVEGIVSNITDIRNIFIESLEKVQDSLNEEYNRLAEIQAAIVIEKKNLEELYGLSSNADSFAAILIAQKESKERFDEDMKVAKETINTEILETKASWSKEKVEYTDIEKEAKSLLQKTRNREEEEYDYILLQKRKKEKDSYDLAKSQQEAKLKEDKLNFEKDFAEREKTIVESEQEFRTLKKASDQFPKELEKVVQTAKGELEAKLTTEFIYERNLLAKETEGQANLKDLQIKTLETKISEMENQIKLFGQKADTSEKSVKDIALKAIESSTKIHVVEKEKVE